MTLTIKKIQIAEIRNAVKKPKKKKTKKEGKKTVATLQPMGFIGLKGEKIIFLGAFPMLNPERLHFWTTLRVEPAC